jgi:hypothetical protein
MWVILTRRFLSKIRTLLEKALHDKYGLVRRPAWREIEKLKEA